MSPEIKTLRYAMATREKLGGGFLVGFDVAKVRADLSLVRHIEPTREDMLELVEMLDWMLELVDRKNDGDIVGFMGRVRGISG